MFDMYIERRVDESVAPYEAAIRQRFEEMGDRAFDGRSGDAMTMRFDKAEDRQSPFGCGPIHYTFEQPVDAGLSSARQEDTTRPFLTSLKARAAGFLALFAAGDEQPATPPVSLRISYRD